MHNFMHLPLRTKLLLASCSALMLGAGLLLLTL
jgi:hypothetical protein